MKKSENRRSILITGCSSGFGRVTALRLAREGWLVFATIRKNVDQKSLLIESAGQIITILADVTKKEHVLKLARTITKRTNRLNALLNNAGTAFPAPLEYLTPADLRAQLEVNCVAPMAVTQALLPLLKNAQGTIINVSSVSGRISSPLLGAYSASKFAMEALSDALRMELAPFKVKVVLIEPGSSPTAIWNSSLQRLYAMPSWNKMQSSPYLSLIRKMEEIAKKSAIKGFSSELFAGTVVKILGSTNPRTRYLLPRGLALRLWLRNFIPDRTWDRLIRHHLKW